MGFFAALPVGAVTAPPLAISLTAVFLGGLSGAIFAVQRKFAVTGVLAIAIATGLGGGIIRDLLLGRVPVALTDPSYLPLVVFAAFFGFFFASLVHRGRLFLDILDPIWMGLFAVIGAQQTLNAGLGSFAAILVGCISAFGGAVIRDLLAGETPQLVLPGPINYLAAILGAIIYVGMVEWAGVDKVVAEWVSIGIVFGLRMLALKYGIRAPEPMDVPRHLKHRVFTGRRRKRRPGMRVYHANLAGPAGTAADPAGRSSAGGGPGGQPATPGPPATLEQPPPDDRSA
jgi:uncharacterized membrane protein YeiH